MKKSLTSTAISAVSIIIAAISGVLFWVSFRTSFDMTVEHFSRTPIVAASYIMLGISVVLAVCAAFPILSVPRGIELRDSSVFSLFSYILCAAAFAAYAAETLIAYRSRLAYLFTKANVLPALMTLLALVSAAYFLICAFAPKLKNARSVLAFAPIVWAGLCTLSIYFDSSLSINNPTKALNLLAAALILIFLCEDLRYAIGTQCASIGVFTSAAAVSCSIAVAFPRLAISLADSEGFGFGIIDSTLFAAGRISASKVRVTRQSAIKPCRRAAKELKMFSRTVSRIICTALVLAFAVLSAISAVCADFPEQRASVYVYDSADVISSEIEDDINRRADALYAMCGAQIITVCVTTTGDTPIDKYTAELFNTWKIGSVQRNNGMLLIMATEDREYWILQGNGIKNDITDSDLQAVNNECLEQYFRDEKYGEGALAVFDRLLEKFQALYSIDISNWDGKYIDFSYPETESESGDAQKQTSPGKPLMGFFKTVLWIAAAVLLIVIVFVAVSVLRRSEFANGSLLRRRRNKVGHSPYVGIPPKVNLSGNRGGARRPTSAGDPRARQNGYAQNGMRQNTPPARPEQPREMQNPQYTQDPRMRSQQQYRADPRYTGERDPRRVQRDAQNTVYPQNPPYIGQGGNVPSGNPYGQINHRNGDVRRTQGNHGGANTAGRQYPDGSQDGRQ